MILFAKVIGPAVAPLYPVVIVTFSVKVLGFKRITEYVSALSAGLTRTRSPMYVSSMLLAPAGGASVKTICPLMSAYESVFCFTPAIQTITEDSDPVP